MGKSKVKDKWKKDKHGENYEGPMNIPSKYITTRCNFSKVSWLEDTPNFSGHKRPKGGRRKVSGIVRAKIKKEIANIIKEANYD